MAQQQHNVRLVNGQNPPPQHLLSAAAANGGVSFKFGGNGGLESVHERNNGVIQYSSLKIKVRFYPLWLRIRFISAGFELVLIHTQTSC